MKHFSQMQTTLSTLQTSTLKQIEHQLQKENYFVARNLDLERVSGWNDAIPQRMIIEVGKVDGVWNTSSSWFSKCRTLVQVEFAGCCMNSKINENVKDPLFNELFIFPFGDDNMVNMPRSFTHQVFVTVLTVEGSGEIPDPAEISPKNDPNIYKRIAEFCLDVTEIRQDQLVHQLTLELDVDDLDPKPSPLQHTLRQCEISGFDI